MIEKQVHSILMVVVMGISYVAGEQFVFIDDNDIYWTCCAYDYPTMLGPKNWESPINYKNGRVYVKIDVIEKPSNKDVAFQLCMWQDGYTREGCAMCQNYSTTGTFYFDFGSPSSHWWMKPGNPLDFSRAFSYAYFMNKDGACGSPLLMSSACGAACYNGGDLGSHIPIRIRAKVIVVSEGSTLVPPDDWQCPWEMCRSEPVMSVVPTTLNFTATHNGANPQPQEVTITNIGRGTLAAVTASVSYTSGSGWITVTPSGSEGNSQAIVNSVNVSGLAEGNYAATITVTCSNAVPSTATYSVSLAVRGVPVFSSVAVSPAAVNVQSGGTVQFTASAHDQFGEPLSSQPSFSWSVSGGGTISSAGLFTAGTTDGGYTVTASATVDGRSKSGTAQVVVSDYLFFDDFEDGNAEGWTVVSGTWGVSGGSYVNTGTSNQNSIVTAGSPSWGDYVYEVDVRPTRGTGQWVIFRAQSNGDFYLFQLSDRTVYKKVGGSYTAIASASGGSFTENTTYRIRVSVEGNAIRILSDGMEILSTGDNTFSTGAIGMGGWESSAQFDNVAVMSAVGSTAFRRGKPSGDIKMRLDVFPSSGGWLVAFPFFGEFGIEVLSLNGKRVLYIQGVGPTYYNINTRGLTPGIYMIHAFSPGSGRLGTVVAAAR